MKIRLVVFIEVESDGDLSCASFTDSRGMADIRSTEELPILSSCFAAILAGKIDEQRKPA